MKKRVILQFAKEGYKEMFLKLETGNDAQRRLFDELSRAFLHLEDNPYSGVHISKRLIPNEFKNLSIKNLWKLNLSNGFRLLYSIESDSHTLVIIIEWLSHKKYERRFKY